MDDDELSPHFKSAAFSVTTLYKESLKQSKKAYQAGYHKCLQDIWAFIQVRPSTQIIPNDLISYLYQRKDELDLFQNTPILAGTVAHTDSDPNKRSLDDDVMLDIFKKPRTATQ
jgi:hypothetical protein